MRTSLVRASQVRHEVHAIELPRRVHFATRSGDDRWQQVEVHHREIVGLASGKFPLPLCDEWDSGTTFKRGHLVAAQPAVVRGRALSRPSVVTNEEVERVLFETRFAHLGHHTADGVVHSNHHRREQLSLLVRDLREPVEIFLRSLERGVLCVEGKIQQNWLRLVLFDPVDRPIGVSVGRIERVILDLFHVVRDSRIDELSRVKEGGVGERAVELIETAFRRPVGVSAPQVPLADGGGGVTQTLQPVSDCRLVQTQA